MADEQAISVNFGKPMALFPLDSAVLLPQQVVPLHIFEPRYRQMVEQSLDGSGQIAMAVFAGKGWKEEYHGRPPLRQAVCIGQIMRHEKLDDGRFNILLQGVCRARIERELDPEQGVLYRRATLEPVGVDEEAETKLYGVRERLRTLLEDGRVRELKNGGWVLERLEDEDIPTHVLLELVAFALPLQAERKYDLLAEGDAGERAAVIEAELTQLSRLVVASGRLFNGDWPKGCSWN